MDKFSRFVCFTFNNPTSTDVDAIKLVIESKCTYGVFGLETGDSGTPHLQGYIELPSKPRYRLRTIKSWFPRNAVHLEARKGSAVDADNYCKKGTQSHSEWSSMGVDGPNFGRDAQVWTHGDAPRVGQGKRSDIEKVREDILEGRIKNEWDLICNVTSLPALKFGQIVFNNMPHPAIKDAPRVLWLHGATGTGKSFASAKLIERLHDTRGWSFWRSNGTFKWFDGYNRQEIVWFDDFRFTGGPDSFAYLLQLTDRYPMQVPIKGGFVAWRPRVLIFTAPKPVGESFGCLDSTANGEAIEQFLRRVSKQFDFNTDGASSLHEDIWQYLGSAESQHLPRSFRDAIFDEDTEDSDYESGESGSDSDSDSGDEVDMNDNNTEPYDTSDIPAALDVIEEGYEGDEEPEWEWPSGGASESKGDDDDSMI